MINIQEDLTFEKFGYYSNQLTLGSHKLIISKCIKCKNLKESELRQTTELCGSCARKISHPKNLYFCKICNKEISRTTKTNMCKICSNKTRKQIRKRLFGEKNGSWKGGKSLELYPLGWTETFKEQIRYRDKYICQLCHTHEVDCICKLHVHHIDYDKENLNPKNLISLCRKCHPKTNVNRNYWYSYFLNKMKEILNANESN
jgi:hypothetical protein